MIHRFGPFEYDAQQRLLFRHSQRVPLEPKVADTLHALLAHRGQIVDKAELLKLVWPGTNVEEIGLARNISLLRKALEDDHADQPFIETVPRRGYRFVADPAATAAPESAAAPLVPLAPKRRRRTWLLAFALLAAAALVYYQFYIPSPYLGPKTGASLAVVPFVHLGAEPAADSFTPGFNELLVAQLAQVPHLQIVAPSTVARHQRAGVSMGLMGRLLALDALIEGTTQKLDHQVRVTARLVDVHTGKVIWSETFHQPTSDPAAAQAAIAQAVTGAIAARLTQPKPPSPSP